MKGVIFFINSDPPEIQRVITFKLALKQDHFIVSNSELLASSFLDFFKNGFVSGSNNKANLFLSTEVK